MVTAFIFFGGNMKKKFVVTDVDGVLLDRMPVYGEVFSELLEKELGINKDFSKKIYFSSAGTSIDKQFRMVILDAKRSVGEGMIDFLVNRFFKINAEKEILFFPGAKEVISDLTMKGCALFATSGSNTDELKTIFIKNNLLYSMVMGSDEIKKSSEHIRIFAESVSLSMQEFCKNGVYIGDGPGDMKIARECDLLAIGILTCPGICERDMIVAGADFVINDISEFPQYVL